MLEGLLNAISSLEEETRREKEKDETLYASVCASVSARKQEERSLDDLFNNWAASENGQVTKKLFSLVSAGIKICGERTYEHPLVYMDFDKGKNQFCFSLIHEAGDRNVRPSVALGEWIKNVKKIEDFIPFIESKIEEICKLIDSSNKKRRGYIV